MKEENVPETPVSVPTVWIEPPRASPALPAQIEETTEIGSILRLAVERGDVDVEALGKLVDLYERVDGRRAMQAFSGALAAFQSECPTVPKTSTAEIATKSGARYKYAYAELDEIARTIRPWLHKHGISYSWDSRIEGETMIVICTIRHERGHAASASFLAPLESASERMAPQHKHGAALTYAKRQSLIQALGLIVGDPDPDAAIPQGAITQDQATQINDLIAETKSDKARFLKAVGAASVEAIPAGAYKLAVTMLEGKRK